MTRTIAVVGASANRAKFGNKCVRAYAAEDWNVIPIHPTATEIEGLRVLDSVDSVAVSIDRISVYLPPETSLRLLDQFAVAKAEVWFNPGSADERVLAAAKARNLRYRAACSIVDIGRSPSEFPEDPAAEVERNPRILSPEVMRTRRPTSSEANDYYFTYIDKVPDGDVVIRLRQQIIETQELLESVSDEQGDFRYASGKWSVKEVLGHLADTERVFTYRALAFSRGDATPIPGMDQDDWITGGRFDDLSIEEVVGDLVAVRGATSTLFEGLSDEQWQRRGVASGFEFQVGAIAWIVAGHELHHRGVLVERYGVGS